MAYSDYWSTDSGTMASARLRERKLYVAQIEVFAEGTTVWWSDDGTDNGSSIFTLSTAMAPWTEVMMMSQGSNSRFTDVGYWGPMFAQGEALAEGQFMWGTSYDATYGLWKTQIWFGGSSAAGGVIQSGSAGRTAFVYAMGA